MEVVALSVLFKESYNIYLIVSGVLDKVKPSRPRVLLPKFVSDADEQDNYSVK